MARQSNPINHPYYLELLKSMIQLKKKGNIQQPLTGYDLEELVEDGLLSVSKEYVKKIFRKKNPRYSIGLTILNALTDYVREYGTYQSYEDFETKEYWSEAVKFPRKPFIKLTNTHQSKINKQIISRIDAILSEKQELKKEFGHLHLLGINSTKNLEEVVIEMLYKQQKQEKNYYRLLEKEKNYEYQLMKLQTSVNAIEELLLAFGTDMTPQNALTKNALILGKLKQVKELMHTPTTQKHILYKAPSSASISFDDLYQVQKQFQLGLIAQIEFNFNRANIFFQKVLTTRPNDLKCLFFIARNHYFLGALTSSITYFEKALAVANEEKNEQVSDKINYFLQGLD